MKTIIETERLVLREFHTGDTAFIVRLLNTEGWLRFIGDRGVRSEEDAVNYLTNGPIKSYAANGFGLWHVALKSDGTPIGMCGLLKRDTLDHPDIGFALLPEAGKQGYAFEMAQAALEYGRDVLEMRRIVAIVNPDNEHSTSLLRKLGLKEESTVQMPGDETKLLFFGIDF